VSSAGCACACIFASLLSLLAQADAGRHATAQFVRALQAEDGGFLPGSPGATASKGSLRATTAALRALKYAGAEPARREACERFVRRCFDPKTGGFVDSPDAPGQPDVATTAIGIMAVAELKLPLRDYSPAVLKYLGERAKTFEEIRMAAAGVEVMAALPPQAVEWRKQVAAMRNRDGSFGDGDDRARATASAAATLLRLGDQPAHFARVVDIIRAGQRADGGFGKRGSGSDLETCYRVTRALVMLKSTPNAPRLRAFVARCRNADGGYGIAPGQPSTTAATYYAAIVRHWLPE
jgi:prenyltransferase beta subunit